MIQGKRTISADYGASDLDLFTCSPNVVMCVACGNVQPRPQNDEGVCANCGSHYLLSLDEMISLHRPPLRGSA